MIQQTRRQSFHTLPPTILIEYGIFVSLYIHMEHLLEDALVQHLLRSAGVDFLAGIDGNDPVTVMQRLENNADILLAQFLWIA